MVPLRVEQTRLQNPRTDTKPKGTNFATQSRDYATSSTIKAKTRNKESRTYTMVISCYQVSLALKNKQKQNKIRIAFEPPSLCNARHVSLTSNSLVASSLMPAGPSAAARVAARHGRGLQRRGAESWSDMRRR